MFKTVFSALASFRPPEKAALDPTVFRKVLVFSAAGIGDTLSDSPAVRALKETYPQVSLTVVTHRRRALIAAHNPFIDHLVLYRKGFFSFFRLLFMLKKQGFDLIVILRANDPDIWPLAYSINRRAVVSCPIMTRMGFLISHPVMIPKWDDTHGVEQTLEIVRAVGADTVDKRLVYEVSPQEREDIGRRLAEMGIAGRPLVVFQVGGGKRGGYRDWGYQNYVAVGKRLLDKFDAVLLLTGGQDNARKAALIAQGISSNRLVNLAGKLSLTQTAALLKSSDLLVSTDTGVMHLGFAVGDVTVLCLLHCIHPATRVGPYGYDGQHSVIQLVPPDGQRPSMAVSMDLISPEAVYEKAAELCRKKGIPEKAHES